MSVRTKTSQCSQCQKYDNSCALQEPKKFLYRMPQLYENTNRVSTVFNKKGAEAPFIDERLKNQTFSFAKTAFTHSS